MHDLMQDIKYAARSLAKTPGFTAIVIATLGLGIGVTATIFVAVNAIMLRPFPFLQQQERLVAVTVTTQRGPMDVMSYPDYHDVRAQVAAFADAAAHSTRSYNLATPDGEPERIEGERISASLFPTLGVAPALGRGFRPDEDRPGGPAVVVLSDQLWQRRFGGARDVINQTVTLNGLPHTVVGVMPPGFTYPADQLLWTPLQQSPTDDRGSHYLDMVARLKPGVTLESAALELGQVAARLEREYPESNTGFGFTLENLRDQNVGEAGGVLMIMMGAVGFVLLIACANVANLLLARASRREREIAVRTALGAGRLRIVRQLLTESLLLAAGGAALGLVLALWGNDLFVAALPADRPFWMQFTFDWRVFAFIGLVAVGTALVFGLAPSLHASRADLTGGLKEGGQGAGTSRGHGRVRSSLVVAEVALALVLLVGAGLMMRSFWSMQGIEPGFERSRAMELRQFMTGPQYDSAAVREAYLRRGAERVAALPGVAAAAWVSGVPLGGNNSLTAVEVEGRSYRLGEEPEVALRVAHGDVVRALGLALRAGRSFTQRDAADAQGTVLINETMAQRLWPGENAVGRRFRFARDATNPLFTVIGVVGDVRGRGLDAPAENQMWLSYGAAPNRSMSLVVRSAGDDPLALAPAVRAALRELDGALPVFNVQSLEQVFARSFWARALYGKLFASFGAIALLLAGVGLYGVVAYGVAQRTREFGVRMALGAGVRDVLGLVIRNGMALTLLGVALGGVAALGVTGALRNMLYGVGPRDPATFGAVAAFLIGVALLACYVPARRAAKVAPSEALRYE